MSSAGAHDKRNAHDYYPTPGWCVRRFMEARPDLVSPANRILEPCAGSGEILRQLRVKPWQVTAVELRWETKLELERFAKTQFPAGVWVGSDFCVWAKRWKSNHPEHAFDVAISNPPFLVASGIIESALSISKRVAMLLRLDFLGSAARHPWMSEHMPDVYVLPDRPSFRADGHTDSNEYAWFLWDHKAVVRDCRYGKVRLLNVTQLEERKADHEELFGKSG